MKKTILIVLLFAACTPKIDPVEQMPVKAVAIADAPEHAKIKHAEYNEIIKGTVKTDMLTKEQKAEIYILRYGDLATAEHMKYGVPACITLAQGILESAAGQSRLARKNKNHFGIKCFSRKCSSDHCSNFKDDSHKDFFRNYKSVWESYRDHSLFLNRDHYKDLHKCKTAKCWARGLQSKGYATSKTYSRKLLKIIHKYDLKKYDFKYPG